MPNFLSLQQLQERVPAAFAIHPHPRVSNKYTFLPTTRIVQDMTEQKWYPVAAWQQFVKNISYEGFQRHLIRFRSGTDPYTIEDVSLEAVLQNGHNGFTALNLYVAVHINSENITTIVPDQLLKKVRVVHRGYSSQEIHNTLNEYVSLLPTIKKIITQLKGITLSEKQCNEFAKQAADLRWKHSKSTVPIEHLLSRNDTRIHENDLWSIFKVVSSNLLKGGVKMKTPSGRKRKTRKLKSIQKYISVTKSMWDIALKFSEQVA